MKFTKYFMPFAALALLASCADDKLVDSPVNPDPTPVEGDGSSMYMTVNVSLPNLPSTRASFDGFEEGTPDEYAVNSVDLYIFKQAAADKGTKTPEESATFVDRIQIGFGDLNDGENDIEKKLKATFQISQDKMPLDPITQLPIDKSTKQPTGEEYYGLLVINHPGDDILPDPSGQKMTYDAWNTNIMHAATSSASSVSVMKDETNGFVMSNAPYLVEEEGNTGTYNRVSVLEKIDTKQFAISPKQAENPAAIFYVQRGVAKVGIAYDNDGEVAVQISYLGDEETLTKSIYTNLSNFAHSAIIKSWTLDITNQGTFPVQSVAKDIASYISPVADTNPDWSAKWFYQTTEANNAATKPFIWWGIDPNYTGTEESNSRSGFNSMTQDTETTNYLYNVTSGVDTDPEDTMYCLENTMNYNQMNKRQTTRVVLKADYLIKDTWSKEEILAQMYPAWLAEQDPEPDDVSTAWEAAKEDYFTQHSSEYPTVGKYKYLKNEGETAGKEISDDYIGMIVYNDVPVYLAAADKKGDTFTSSANGKSYEYLLSDLVATTAQEKYRSALMAATVNEVVIYYPNAETYYAAYIRHFDNTETQFTTDGRETGEALNEYTIEMDDYKPGHLGRFGVLRNNMYEVNIMAVGGYGLPVVPPPTDTPDDKIDDLKYNARVDINILKWAKRTNDYIPR